MKTRLKKISKYYDSIMHYGHMVDIFVNPSDKEINEAKKASGDGIVRGIIDNDGTEYCWDGWTLHHDLLNKINYESFHFSYGEGYGWFCDAIRKYTKKEFIELIIKYQNKLSKYGILNDRWEICDFSDGDVTINCYSFDELKEILETETNK